VLLDRGQISDNKIGLSDVTEAHDSEQLRWAINWWHVEGLN